MRDVDVTLLLSTCIRVSDERVASVDEYANIGRIAVGVGDAGGGQAVGRRHLGVAGIGGQSGAHLVGPGFGDGDAVEAGDVEGVGGGIGGAILDTWYQYPSAERPECAPSTLDFAALPNVLMTPHMSGWTDRMLARRRDTLADNIQRLASGRPLVNVLHAATDRPD